MSVIPFNYTSFSANARHSKKLLVSIVILLVFSILPCFAANNRVLVVTTEQQSPATYCMENGEYIVADLVSAGMPFDVVTYGKFVDMQLGNHDVIFLAGHTSPTPIANVVSKCQSAMSEGRKVFIFGTWPFHRYDANGNLVENTNYAASLFPVTSVRGQQVTCTPVVPAGIEKDADITSLGLIGTWVTSHTLSAQPKMSVTCNGYTVGFLFPQGGLIDDSSSYIINLVDFGKVAQCLRYGNPAVVGFATDRIDGKPVVSIEVHCDVTNDLNAADGVNSLAQDYGLPLTSLLVYKNLTPASTTKWNQIATNPLMRIGSHSRTHPQDWPTLTDTQLYNETLGVLNDQRAVIPATVNYMDFSGNMNPSYRQLDIMYPWSFLYGGGGGGGSSEFRRIKQRDGSYYKVQCMPTRAGWMVTSSQCSVAPFCIAQTIECDWQAWSDRMDYASCVKQQFDQNVKFGMYSYTYIHDYAMNSANTTYTINGVHLSAMIRSAIEYLRSQDAKFVFTDDLVAMLRDFMNGYVDYTTNSDGSLRVTVFRPGARINQIKVQCRNGLAPTASGISVRSQHLVKDMLYVDLLPEQISAVTINWTPMPPQAPMVSVASPYTAGVISANWTPDAYSPVAEYMYALGSEPGGNDVLDWTPDGTDLSAYISSPQISSGCTYYVSVKAKSKSGCWSEPGVSRPIVADLTPPSRPVVTVDASKTGEIAAIWQTQDGESGICDNQYAMGSAPGSADIVAWTDAGLATQIVIKGTLLYGQNAYVSVKSRNGAGAWSYVGYSNRVSLTAPDTVAGAKGSKDNCTVYIADAQVTATFSGCTYVEQNDRACGIRINGPEYFLPGDVICISGTVTSQNGERVILNPFTTYVQQASLNPNKIKPLYLANNRLGGGRLNSATPGVTNGSGLNNLGLLITTHGRVTCVGTDFFYIDDGSHIADNPAYTGVKVDAAKLTTKPRQGDFVKVTGISSVEVVDGTSRRLLRALSWAKIPVN